MTGPKDSAKPDRTGKDAPDADEKDAEQAERDLLEEELEEGLEDSFPASDPPSFNARGAEDLPRIHRNGIARS